jgi:protein phosphatase
MIVHCHNAQDYGTRAEQQDAFAFSDTTNAEAVRIAGVLAVLADGMGGLEHGAEASTLAIQIFLERYVHQVTPSTIPETLADATHAANAAVLRIADQAGQTGSAGSTLVAAVVKDKSLHWISVGDSRLYRFSEGRLTQLSTDHVYAADLDRAAAEGSITDSAARQHPEREALTSCLGMDTLDRIDQGSLDGLREDDLFLLCSDGLYKTLDDGAIVAILRSRPADPAAALLAAVKAKGHPRQDNVTVLALSLRKPHVQERLRSTLQTQVKVGYVLAGVFVFLLALWGYQEFMTGPRDQRKSAAPEGAVADSTNVRTTEPAEPQGPPCTDDHAEQKPDSLDTEPPANGSSTPAEAEDRGTSFPRIGGTTE